MTVTDDAREAALDEALRAVHALHERAADDRDRAVSGSAKRIWAQAEVAATADAKAAIAALKRPAITSGEQ